MKKGFLPMWSPKYKALLPPPHGNPEWRERFKKAKNVLSDHLLAQVGGLFSFAFLGGQLVNRIDRQKMSKSAEETKKSLESSKDILTSVNVGVGQIIAHLEESKDILTSVSVRVGQAILHLEELKKSSLNVEIHIQELREELKGLKNNKP